MGLSTALVLGSGGCTSGELAFWDFYRGQVVDAATGNPLEGVLVVFVWERHAYSEVRKRITTEVHAATEVLTDADGHFEVSAASETTFRPSVVEVRRTDPIFFKPGYFLLYRVKSKGEPMRDPTIIYLKRADNSLEALEGLSSDYPFGRTPMFLKALNEERARLGLPPIRPSQN